VVYNNLYSNTTCVFRDVNKSAAPETPPSPNDAGHYVDQPPFSTDLESFYSAQDLQDDMKGEFQVAQKTVLY